MLSDGNWQIDHIKRTDSLRVVSVVSVLVVTKLLPSLWDN